MIYYDTINSLFEISAGFIFWFNIVEITIDKQVKGISFCACIYFLIWAYWNIYYYFSIGQTYSFWGAVFLAMPNTIWILLVMKYKRKKL
jgi:hypothetical protein